MLFATKLLATSYSIVQFLMLTVEQLSTVLLKHCLNVVSMLFVIIATWVPDGNAYCTRPGMFPEYWFLCRDITYILLHTDGACKSKYTTVLTSYIYLLGWKGVQAS